MSETIPAAKIPGVGWLDWATRTTAILAVIAALSSGRWGASNLQAILEQGKVNDTWSYYQSESIKEHSAEQMRDLVKALSADQPGDRAAVFEELRKKFDAQYKHENENKKMQKVAAEEFQRHRDAMVERGFWFEISFTALQLGVVLCTIASGAKRKGPWLFAMGIGVLGLLALLNGFLMVKHAPASWYQGVSQKMEYKGSAAKPAS